MSGSRGSPIRTSCCALPRAGNTVIVPAGSPVTGKASGSGNAQVVAYTVPVK
jgi:hypothetical protein